MSNDLSRQKNRLATDYNLQRHVRTKPTKTVLYRDSHR